MWLIRPVTSPDVQWRIFRCFRWISSGCRLTSDFAVCQLGRPEMQGTKIAPLYPEPNQLHYRKNSFRHGLSLRSRRMSLTLHSYIKNILKRGHNSKKLPTVWVSDPYLLFERKEIELWSIDLWKLKNDLDSCHVYKIITRLLSWFYPRPYGTVEIW